MPTQQPIPTVQVVGQGRLSVFFFDVYDMRLYAPDGQWSPEKPFVLSFFYLRDVEGEDIASHSVDQMRQQGMTDDGKLEDWYQQMKRIFPDTAPGMTLSAVFIPGQQTEFFQGERPIGIIQGGDFVQWFSGIWLSEKSSKPDLRRKLLKVP